MVRSGLLSGGMCMGALQDFDPEIAELIRAENRRQHAKIRLIASENYTSHAVLEATGSILTNKYSEGYPGDRCYEGQQYIDRVERTCIERARALFGAEHVNVQPYSGSPANQAVLVALAEPGDPIMGMSLAHGGHLTHGAPASISGRYYRAVQYGVDRTSGVIDYDEVEELARRHRPKVIFCGHSAYPRIVDFARFARIGAAVGAVVVADMAHFSGLVAAGVHPNPVPVVDVVTTTTHKSLRGPRGGMILCRRQYAQAVDRAVFPGLQGGPHNHVTAGLAVALKEATTEEFRRYARQVVANARELARELAAGGFGLISGGTDNHLLLIDMSSKGVTGRQMSRAMDTAGMVCNCNSIPFDPRPPLRPSGIRIGTPAVTSRGFGSAQMRQIAAWMERVARLRSDPGLDLAERKKAYRQIAAEVHSLCDGFPAPGLAYGADGQPV
ncbi:MAG: serine hydroxymethyltransferase [Candidatus Latescibacterota bacterium]